MNLKRTKLVTIALAFVMVASAISGGLVLADNPPDGAAQPGNSRFDQRQHRNAGNGEILTELLGLTTEDIRTQRADGLSLVQIAESVGVSEAELVAALTQGVTERLTQAVIDGKITQEQADTLLDRAVVRTTEMVNNTEPRQPRPRQQRPNQRQFGRSGGNGGGSDDDGSPQRQQRPNQRQFGRFGGNGETLTELLGLTTEDIRTQRADGLSLVQIAESVGVSEAELVAALTQGVTERLTQAVIDGKITQEQADTLLDRAVVRTTEMVNNTEPRQPRPRQQRPNQRQFGRSGGNGGGNSGGTPAGLSG